MLCKEHKKYKAEHAPTNDCLMCWKAFAGANWRHGFLFGKADETRRLTDRLGEFAPLVAALASIQNRLTTLENEDYL